MILVSRTIFSGSRNQMVPFISSCIWPCLISHLWTAWSWSLSCLPIAEMTSVFYMCLLRSWSITSSLAVCMLAKYGCIMLSAILQKHVLHHNFWTEAHRMMILVSSTMFSGSRNQLALFILIIGLSACLSACPSAHLALHLSTSLTVGLSLPSVGRSIAQPC